jgi:hypothetical protein
LPHEKLLVILHAEQVAVAGAEDAQQRPLQLHRFGGRLRADDERFLHSHGPQSKVIFMQTALLHMDSS